MTLKEKFNELESSGGALLATNFYNFETVTGVLRAAANLNVPIILQASPSTINYLGVEMTAAIGKTAMRDHGVQGWLHLDHAEDPEMIRACLEAGFDSVMIDASEKSIDKNVEITSRIVDLASRFDANVEAELGYVAKLGQSHEKEGFTKPDEAADFVQRTGVNALAVAIGSAHGFYTKDPKLDLDLLSEIHSATDAALVLHGGSGIPDEQLQEGIRRGIRKINLATEIKNIFMKTVQKELSGSDEIDLRQVFPPAMDQVTTLVTAKLKTVRSA
ncbi:MAG: class II fructose-bisphosphate aldolase [Balneolaceae bacterium]